MTKIKNIEALRFILAIIIILFHINGTIIQNYTSVNIQPFNTSSASVIVNFFFVMSGFFLYLTSNKQNSPTISNFILDKIARLWPVLAFYYVVATILSIAKAGTHVNSYDALLNLLFCNTNGINLNYKGIIWFVSSLFWALIFLYGLIKTTSKEKINFIICLITYFAYVLLVNNGFSREVKFGFLSFGVLMGVAGIGLGYILALINEKTKNIQIYTKNKITNAIKFILISTIEIYCFIFIIQNTVFHKISYSNNMIFIVIFSILFYLFIQQKGLISKLFNNNISVFLGRYTFSMYVMQQLCINVLNKYYWTQAILDKHPLITIFISVIFCTTIGITTYYIVEQPTTKWYKNKISNSRSSI